MPLMVNLEERVQVRTELRVPLTPVLLIRPPGLYWGGLSAGDALHPPAGRADCCFPSGSLIREDPSFWDRAWPLVLVPREALVPGSRSPLP